MSGGISGTTIAVTIAAAVASAATAAVSMVQQHAQAQYQAAVAKNNAKIAQQNADDAIQRGQVEMEQQRTKTKQLIGQQRADLAAQGGDINSGSALDIQADTAGLGKLDELQIQNNAQREARNYLIQKNDFDSQESAANIASSNALIGGGLGIASSFIGGAASGAATGSKLSGLFSSTTPNAYTVTNHGS